MPVVVVSVGKPVACTVVNLHVSHPHGVVDFDFCIEKVGAGIGVVQPRIEHFHSVSVGGGEG